MATIFPICGISLNHIDYISNIMKFSFYESFIQSIMYLQFFNFSWLPAISTSWGLSTDVIGVLSLCTTPSYSCTTLMHCFRIFVFFLSILVLNHSLSRSSLVAQLVKNPPAMWETWVWSLGWEDPLENRKATCSSILAWRIPWTTPHGVTKSQIWLSNFHLHINFLNH